MQHFDSPNYFFGDEKLCFYEHESKFTPKITVFHHKISISGDSMREMRQI
jgi:hypothetical protein